MSDITINNNESQNKKQKTTPVTESLFEPNNSIKSHSGVISQIWLALLDLIRNPNKTILSLNELNGELAKMILERHNLLPRTAVV